MINSYRPVPLPPPPPPAPQPLPPVGFSAPAAPAAWTQPQAAWPQQRAPLQLQGLNWNGQAEFGVTVGATPLGALLGAGIGFLVAGPLGAARGAMIGAALPGTVCTGYEFFTHNPWWGKPEFRTGVGTLAAFMAFPAISAVGYGAGMAIAGASGAAWGTIIAAAAPLVLLVVGATIYSWFRPPTYDPGPAPTPTGVLR